MSPIGPLRPALTIVAASLALTGLAFAIFGNEMFSPGPLSVRTKENVVLGAVRSHAETAENCSACHAPPWNGEPLSVRCLHCHTEVADELAERKTLHGRMPAAEACTLCHHEHRGPHAPPTDFTHFSHDFAAFPLTGRHQTTACAACHKNEQYRGTPQSCVACHGEPQSHRGRFGTNCASCHTTQSWRGVALRPEMLADFDHDRTAFPLTGMHRTTGCAKCHSGGSFKGTSQACYACHADPVVHRGRFGLNCGSCHTTATWKGVAMRAELLVNFDHDRTPFPLTGMHRTTACAKCHVNDVFKGTSQACVACHVEPKVHLGRYGVNCATCHSTATWKNATLTAEFHKFPIDHGGGKQRGQCITCHKVVGEYRSYTCYGCHKHDPGKTAEKHRKWNIVELEACAKCHPTGRKRPDQPAKQKKGDLTELLREILLADDSSLMRRDD